MTIAITLSGLILSSCGTGKKLEGANQQIQQLNGQVENLNKQVAEDHKVIEQLRTDNIRAGKEAEYCRKVKAAISTKLDNLNSALAEKGSSMKQVREKASAALAQFRDAGADVTYKNGMVYVSMADKLLFPSGSTKLSDEGRQALSVVADVLADNPGVTAIIVGNTDSIAIRKSYIDNWSLSTERANVIVRILRDNYQVDPARLTAAGKGRFNPLADNNTAGGRAMNRRTDIVLNPDLSRLWNMMENPE